MPLPKQKSEDEQEVKIQLSQGDLEKVFKHFAQKHAPAHIEHKYMPRAYYDSARLALHKNDLSLRMQYKEGKKGRLGGYEQTVKRDLPAANGNLAAGALFRREVKDIMPSHAPDLNAVTDADTKAAVLPFAKLKLKHIFTAAIERRYFNVSTGHGKKAATVELAFDVGEIILQSDGSRHQFFEIELERKAGNAAAIDELREEILKMAPSAKVQPLSKSKQGSQLYIASRKRKP